MIKLRQKLSSAALAVLVSGGLTIVATTPAHAEGKWCNNQTCIQSYDNGTYLGRLEVSIWTQNQAGRVNAKVWSSNGWSQWTHTENVGVFTTYRGWVYPQRQFPSQTRICVEGFKSGGSYGLPCFTVV
ncbi:hypothetical protein ACIA8G_02380 [Lentzea sp. NPDC051213]|uniref:hypothetical protein n=1 Tax=Lentzea sp. NPDC051213 TaxID=3364126 RepID=UPI0037A40DC4